MHDCLQRGALHGIPRDVAKGQRANYTVDVHAVPIREIRPYRHVRGHVIPFEPSIAGVAVEAHPVKPDDRGNRALVPCHGVGERQQACHVDPTHVLYYFHGRLGKKIQHIERVMDNI